MEGVKRIQALHERDINRIVEGIKEPFLSDPERHLILKGLKERQKEVEKLTNDWLRRVGK